MAHTEDELVDGIGSCRCFSDLEWENMTPQARDDVKKDHSLHFIPVPGHSDKQLIPGATSLTDPDSVRAIREAIDISSDWMTQGK